MLPQSFHSCFSKLSSKTQTFAENKYIEFLRSMSSDEAFWNPGSEGTVLITDCSRILVPVQKLFHTFLCWFSVGHLGDDYCIAYKDILNFAYWMVLGRLQLMFFAGYLCPFLCFSFSCELNVNAFGLLAYCAFSRSAWVCLVHLITVSPLFSSPGVCWPHSSMLGSTNSL